MEQRYRIFKPEQVKASVFIIHGMEEHKDRYIPFAQFLCANHVGCVIYDLPGHKEKQKENMGWFGEKDGYLNLIHSAVNIAVLTKKEFPDVPMYCFGHSMGSLIARNFLQKYSDLIDGMILSGAPCYNSAAPLGRAMVNVLAKAKGKKGHSRLLDNMVTGSFNKAVKNPKTDSDWISYNEENVKAFVEDEWCGVPFTIQGYGDLLDLVMNMHKPENYRVTKEDLPVFFMAGEDDPCTGGNKGLEDSIAVLKNAGYKNIDKKVYPHMRHEILNENGRMEVYEDALKWILNHTLKKIDA